MSMVVACPMAGLIKSGSGRERLSMSAIEDDILTEFFRRLDGSEDITEAMIGSLRAALTSRDKLKLEEFTRIFAPPSEEQIP
jgi:hypothetical protein